MRMINDESWKDDESKQFFCLGIKLKKEKEYTKILHKKIFDKKNVEKLLKSF